MNIINADPSSLITVKLIDNGVYYKHGSEKSMLMALSALSIGF